MYSDCTQNDELKAPGQEKKNKAEYQGIHNDNKVRHCIVRSRRHHQRVVDKTMAGTNFNVYRFWHFARGLGMVLGMDTVGTKKIITRIFYFTVNLWIKSERLIFLTGKTKTSVSSTKDWSQRYAAPVINTVS